MYSQALPFGDLQKIEFLHQPQQHQTFHLDENTNFEQYEISKFVQVHKFLEAEYLHPNHSLSGCQSYKLHI